jgi:hypothetical protein
MRMAVPPPFGAKSELALPFGTASSYYTMLKREPNAWEGKKLEEIQVISWTVVQKEMPTTGSLLSSNIQCTLRWYVDKVKSANGVEVGVEASVEWKGEWEDKADKVTLCLFYNDTDSGRQHMVENF